MIEKLGVSEKEPVFGQKTPTAKITVQLTHYVLKTVFNFHRRALIWKQCYFS